MRQQLARQWFLVGLCIVLGLGFALPEFLQPLADTPPLRHAVVAIVMFLTAVALETDRMWLAVRSPRVVLLASLCNYAVVPLIAWLVSPMLTGDLATGLLIIAAAPCTLVSAAVWTRRAGGDEASAILVTIVTNTACFLAAPFWIFVTTGQQGVQLDFGDMMLKLGLLVVCPIVGGQLFRQWQPVAAWAGRHKSRLGIAAQLGILTIVFMGAIKCGQQLSDSGTGGEFRTQDYAVMLIAVLAVHTAGLAIGFRLAATLGFIGPARIAVGFAGSQKTLMVGLHVGLNYFGGMTILPMVAYHVGQLVIDTLVSDYLTRKQRVGPPKGSR